MALTSKDALEDRLWKELDGSTFAFVGLFNDPHGDVPMTLVTENPRRGLWIFTKRDNSIAAGGTAVARIVSRGQDFFARLDGALHQEQDEETIDLLWSREIAAWYKEGRADPALVVMRFDIATAELWSGKMSPLTVAKMMMGRNVENDVQDQHAVLSPRLPD